MLHTCFVVLCCQFPGIDDAKIKYIANICNSSDKIFSNIFQKHLHMAYDMPFYHIKTATRRVKAVLLQYMYIHFIAMGVLPYILGYIRQEVRGKRQEVCKANGLVAFSIGQRPMSISFAACVYRRLFNRKERRRRKENIGLRSIVCRVALSSLRPLRLASHCRHEFFPHLCSPKNVYLLH